MDGGAKILGHHIHPILIVFPLGLLSTAAIFEIIYYVAGGATFASLTYWLLLSGVIGGLAAAIFGWIDWFAIPAGTRAKSVGLTHGLTNAAALVAFALSWYLRPTPPAGPSVLASVLTFAGAVLAMIGGWLGGELVERLGIGVHAGANPNAPSSLTNETVRSQ